MKETHSKFKPTCVQVFGEEDVEQQRSSVSYTHSSPSMAVHRGTFETLIPSQFISFTFPNPHASKHTLHFNGDLLRIAVLDSPIQTSDPPLIAAMLVPKNREDDWIFSTKTGHLQLLMNSPGISRLILIGDLPRDDDEGVFAHVLYNRPILDDTKYRMEFQESLAPLLIALSPKAYFINGDLSEIPFVTYEDNVIRSLVVEKCVGSCVGEMLVEDIEIENFDEMEKKSPKREFRRRLRFKRMPNLVQTEISIVPDIVNTSIGEGGFRSETDSLVHPYLPPMLASLSLIAPYLEECNQLGNLKPRVLCIGIGGGALLTFLRTHFEFEVFGVESDEMVVKVAKQYFGLVEDKFLRVFVGDGIEVIRNFAGGSILGDMSSSAGTGNVVTDQCMNVFDNHYSPFDIIMVDLDSSDAISGLGAPPLEFVQRSMLLAVKMALHKFGIIVINVIPLNRSFYDSLISEFREVFSELYEINVGNGENYVLVATVSPIRFVPDDVENSIIKKLKLTASRQYMDSIRKI